MEGKAKIIGFVRDVPVLEKSHNAAYARVWSRILGAEIESKAPSYDTPKTYAYIDINFSGSLNLFDGISNSVYERFAKFVKYVEGGGEVYLFDNEIKDLGKLLSGRVGNASTDERFTEEFVATLSEAWKTVKTVRMEDFVTDELVIGDSHSLGVAPSGIPVYRLDAKTLHGALKGTYIDDMIPDSVKKLTLMFGSIDVRHHLFRQPDAYEAARTLYDTYFGKVKELQARGIEVTIFAPVPIETEARKMAKTTMFKGTPFMGSREERLALTKYIISYMEEHAPCEVQTYPKEWYDMDPTLFEAEVMEKPRGIHIGWPSYRMNDFGKRSETAEDALDEW